MTSRIRFLLLAIASAILFLSAIRLGDLAGYDDALYSTEAKNIVRTGDWLDLSIRGAIAHEHPPLFVWAQAAFFSVFGISDPVAKAPAALSAIATVLLIYWLARRLLRDSLAAAVAMFVMLATPYFIKYAAHAMTDVPTTLLFLCAMCCWSLIDRNPRWSLAAGAFTAMALLTRGLIGLALLGIFAIDWKVTRRISLLRYLSTAAIAILPLACWYGYSLLRYPDFSEVHRVWLQQEVYGPLTPSWRRYTGAFEYAFMLLKSYWPWLPALAAGIALAIRGRRRELYPLLTWAAVVFALCAVNRSRVLRYMLPAYPAFAILSAAAIAKFVPRRFLETAMNWIPPAAVLCAIAVALLSTPNWQAAGILPIARAASNPRGQTIGLYDQGQPRWDEANQLEWYGDCVPRLIATPNDLAQALQNSTFRAFVLDKTTYENEFQRLPHNTVTESGRLVYVRLQ